MQTENVENVDKKSFRSLIFGTMGSDALITATVFGFISAILDFVVLKMYVNGEANSLFTILQKLADYMEQGGMDLYAAMGSTEEGIKEMLYVSLITTRAIEFGTSALTAIVLLFTVIAGKAKNIKFAKVMASIILVLTVLSIIETVGSTLFTVIFLCMLYNAVGMVGYAVLYTFIILVVDLLGILYYARIIQIMKGTCFTLKTNRNTLYVYQFVIGWGWVNGLVSLKNFDSWMSFITGVVSGIMMIAITVALQHYRNTVFTDPGYVDYIKENLKEDPLYFENEGASEPEYLEDYMAQCADVAIVSKSHPAEKKDSKLHECPYCHTIVNPGEFFCPNCGKDLN